MRFHSLNVILDKNLTEDKFIYPQERFVEYGPEDIWWLEKYGFGHWEKVPSNTAYQVDNTILIHPVMWDKINEALLKLNIDKKRFYEDIPIRNPGADSSSKR